MLTPAGERFLREADGVIARAEQALLSLQHSAPEGRLAISVGSDHAWCFAPKIRTFFDRYTAAATDRDAGATLTYSLSGGADRNLFNINGKTGAVTFKASPDYEAKGDSGGVSRTGSTAPAISGRWTA